MRKIISLFARNYEGDRLVRDEVIRGAEWVIRGEGVATEKIDGTACRILDGRLWKRYDCKKGRTPPCGFDASQEPDPITGHHPGWVVVGDGPDDKWHREAPLLGLPDGTYELIGPKIQGNPYHLASHCLVRHGESVLENVPRDFHGIRAWLSEHHVEGIVWHHEDWRMVKIKRRDFGLRWPSK